MIYALAVSFVLLHVIAVLFLSMKVYGHRAITRRKGGKKVSTIQ
jgi:hypothetical protein